jgi:hypothetical protein
MAGFVPGPVPGTVAPAPRDTQGRATRQKWRPRRDLDPHHPHWWGTWGQPGRAREELDPAQRLLIPLVPIADGATDEVAVKVPPIVASDLGDR